ncbi:hypothetical protein [Aeromonas sp. Y311-2]|uniref:hypothetical protein n=1 Tax=Aeromonas sp. Y311-2 TaxID=2990507 RepID=UPI0022E3A431|nr:hypothetical protein [Aeromonas sp. Y311-2]
MSAIKLYDAKLLRAYYDNRALSSIGKSNTSFRLSKAVWGKGFQTTVGGKPSVGNIPLDTSKIDGVFATTDLVLSYVSGRITVRAVLPTGSVPAGELHEFSALGILDESNTLVAVMASTPITVHDRRSLSVEGVIETNIA